MVDDVLGRLLVLLINLREQHHQSITKRMLQLTFIKLVGAYFNLESVLKNQDFHMAARLETG